FALLTEGQRRGAAAEVCPAGLSLAGAIGRRLAAQGGAALIIDYGSAENASENSLQAVRRHQHVDPLADIGEADLAAHGDFARLAQAAGEAGAAAYGPLPQGEFLLRLGIEARAASLRARASPEEARDIDQACGRLLDSGEMGTLFKVLALTAP